MVSAASQRSCKSIRCRTRKEITACSDARDQGAAYAQGTTTAEECYPCKQLKLISIIRVQSSLKAAMIL